MSRGLGSRIALAFFAVLAVGVAIVALARRDEPPDIDTYRVEWRPFVHSVMAEGTLEAVESTPISLPADLNQRTRVAWLLDDGSRVRKGEPVIRLDPTDFEAELRDGRADRTAATEKMAKASASRDATLQQLDLDASLARNEQEIARTFQLKDAEVFSKFERIESAIDADLAGSRLEHAQSVRKSKSQMSASELQLLEIDREQAETKVTRAEKGLSSIEVNAPHDGILLLERNWRGELLRVGDDVWAGRKLAEIPDLSTMQVEAFVLEADAGGLGVGQSADVTLEAEPGKTWKATVSRVDAVAKPRIPGSPVQYFGVTLSLERTDSRVMKPGQRVRAEIEVERRDRALIVPRDAVFRKDGRRVVFRREDSGFKPIAVEVASASLGWAVIADGLEEGDEIALRDPSTGNTKAESAPERGGTPTLGGVG